MNLWGKLELIAILDVLQGRFSSCNLQKRAFARVVHQLCNIKYKNKDTAFFIICPFKWVKFKAASSREICLFQYCCYAEYWGGYFSSHNCPAHKKTSFIASGWAHTDYRFIIDTSQSHPPSHLFPLSLGGGSPLKTHEFVWTAVANMSSLGLQLAKKSFNNEGTPPVSLWCSAKGQMPTSPFPFL